MTSVCQLDYGVHSCTVLYNEFNSIALLQMYVIEYFKELASSRTKVDLCHKFEILMKKHYYRSFFMISRIITVKVGVISRNWRLRLITLSKPWSFWMSQKLNIITVLLYIERKTTGSHIFASSLMVSNTKCTNLTWLPLEISHCGHTWHDYLWPWLFLTWLLYNLQLDGVTSTDFENLL